MYRSLRADQIVATADSCRDRIQQRFPGSGLSRVAEEVAATAGATDARAREIARPFWSLRALSALLATCLLAGILVIVIPALAKEDAREFADFVQGLEAGINATALIGAAIYFLTTLERRVKRHRALQALHELRALAHVVDMHQLTKDPEDVLRRVKIVQVGGGEPRVMSPYEMSQYYDACSELLSILSKIAALFAQGFDDQVALEAVDQIESLTSGLSRKIWQKTMILHNGALNAGNSPA